jgi:hypothetical protein
MANDDDLVPLEPDDFRIPRRYLAPWCFAGNDDGEMDYPPPDDLIDKERWDHITVLPTDVLLRSTSWSGSDVGRLSQLESDWIFSWPEMGSAPFVDEVSLLAGEEFDALVFNAAHGYYRQAIGCLRNSFELMMVAAGLAVTGNAALFQQWRERGHEIGFGQARAWLRDSPVGHAIEADAAPASVFGHDDTSWTKARYARLCGYAHSRAGNNNADFWESNGPVYRPGALSIVESEFRETLALCYLLLRISWPAYAPGPGQPNLLAGPDAAWNQYHGLLQKWL